MQQGLQGQADRGSCGATVVILGDARVRPGDSVVLEDLPHGDGSYRVLAVRHRLSSRVGFTSMLSLEAAA